MLYRAHTGSAEHGGKSAAHHVAIGKHVRYAGGNAEIVFQHNELAILPPHQIGAADVDISAVRHGEAPHLRAVMLATVDQRARDQTVAEHARLGINIVQEKVEGVDALL